MQRINDRSVRFTEPESLIVEVAREEWVEGTDPHPFVNDLAAEYGEVVQTDFITWLCHSLIEGSIHGFAIGTAWDGSTVADVAVGPNHTLTLTLADGRTVQAA